MQRWRGSRVPNSQPKNRELQIELSYENVENLESFSALLNKDINTLLNEALSLYFESEQEKIIQKAQDEDQNLTSLDFDEFWDGVDI